jgi:hypothetical protein
MALGRYNNYDWEAAGARSTAHVHHSAQAMKIKTTDCLGFGASLYASTDTIVGGSMHPLHRLVVASCVSSKQGGAHFILLA